MTNEIVASQKDDSQNTPDYSPELIVTYKTATGPKKNGIELIFNKEAPQYIKGMLLSGGFHHHKEKEIWYAYNTYNRKMVAEEVISQVQASRSQLPIVISPMLPRIQARKAENLVKISDRISIPEEARNKRVLEVVKTALKTIGMVHDIDSSFASIPIKFISASDIYDAYFVTNGRDAPSRIEVSIKKDIRVLDVVHEIGHYLDCSLGKEIDYWRGKLLHTIKETKGYIALVNFSYIRGAAKVYITNEKNTKVVYRLLSEVDPSFDYRKYACDDAELIARGYEQYISWKTGLLTSEVERDTEYRINIVDGEVESRTAPILWKMDDFEKTGAMFDQFFDELGWKVTQ